MRRKEKAKAKSETVYINSVIGGNVKKHVEKHPKAMEIEQGIENYRLFRALLSREKINP